MRAIADFLFAAWFLSVSYTHLDVYKRQTLLRSAGHRPEYGGAPRGWHSRAASANRGPKQPVTQTSWEDSMAMNYDPFRELDRLFTAATRTPASLGMPMDLYRTCLLYTSRCV